MKDIRLSIFRKLGYIHYVMPGDFFAGFRCSLQLTFYAHVVRSSLKNGAKKRREFFKVYGEK